MKDRPVCFSAARAQHVSPWLLVFAIVAFSSAGYIVWILRVVVENAAFFWTTYIVFSIFVMGLFIGPFLRVRYELDEKELRLRTGFLVGWRLPYAKISRIFEQDGKLVIDANGVLQKIFSPENEQLLEQLSNRIPHLRRYGNELRADPGPSQFVIPGPDRNPNP